MFISEQAVLNQLASYTFFFFSYIRIQIKGEIQREKGEKVWCFSLFEKIIEICVWKFCQESPWQLVEKFVTTSRLETLYTYHSQLRCLQRELRVSSKGRWCECPVTPGQDVFGPAAPSHLLGMPRRMRQGFWLLKPSDVSMLFFSFFHAYWKKHVSCLLKEKESVYWSAITESTVQMCKEIEGSGDHRKSEARLS